MAKKKKTPKAVGPRRKDEAAYYRAIKKEILDPLFARTMARLESVPQIKAAWIRAVELEFELLTRQEGWADPLVTAALDNLRNVHKAQMIKKFQAALGIDINPFMSDLNIRPFMNQALMDNIALITSIPTQLNTKILSQFEKIFTEKGFDQQAMVEGLQRQFKVSNNRARFIARDQTSKIIGGLNEARQTDLGITSYIWQTSEDERVVGAPGGLYPKGNSKHMNHFERNGKEFMWKFPPPDGHPGKPIG